MRNGDVMIQSCEGCCVNCSRSEQAGNEIDVARGVVVRRDFESKLGNDLI